ncbi:unnamed protein product [Pleuronectes platessa]|uniref:Sushi domain-containing protein n=1 Tax=Pleuronectes platessa TaxID=8262 RepID=A0A9N7V695_PLEPL|nr:unnamed protein product [Pleuronectes platessa]
MAAGAAGPPGLLVLEVKGQELAAATIPLHSRAGHHCTGPPEEHRPCEDPDIQYLQDLWSTPEPGNGFIQNPKDCTVVGSTVEFSCIEGYYRSMCRYPQLSGDVVALPTKESYGIGETVSLHCPAGSLLDGEVSEVKCVVPVCSESPSPAARSLQSSAHSSTPPRRIEV